MARRASAEPNAGKQRNLRKVPSGTTELIFSSHKQPGIWRVRHQSSTFYDVPLGDGCNGSYFPAAMLQLKKPKNIPAMKIFPIQEKFHSPIWKTPPSTAALLWKR